ncbi:MAG TPA: hypothetical protein PK092_03105 [Chitinophagaceae bacterium]|nr:hypothetical protein [Chitinophagaceae bacterium]
MKTLLFILLSFIAITATVSGILMISQPDGSILQLKPELLAGSPFSNYLVPGILLACVVGVVNLVAVFLNMMRHRQRYNAAIAGGAVIITWILVQVMMIGTIHWLHILYFSAGILVVLGAYQLKGRWAV